MRIVESAKGLGTRGSVVAKIRCLDMREFLYEVGRHKEIQISLTRTLLPCRMIVKLMGD